jgi:hypothetical protein
MQIEYPEIQAYLERLHSASVAIQEVRQLGSPARGAEAIKQFGFGRPISVRYQVGEKTEQIVIHRIARNAFGRELDSDRVAAVWLDYETFNKLPRHVKAVDMLVRSEGPQLDSIGDAEDLLLVTVYQPGKPYAEDLTRIRDTEQIDDRDIRRAEALATYLAEIHKTRHAEPMLWRRRLRDLIGHGEGIMGITDSYPLDQAYASEEMLRAIEESANCWRWRLKPLTHRLSQVHGDFHPFNVLFEGDHEFHLLDRSRGEWGEPADDVSCMTINYLFFSLQRSGVLQGAFKELHDVFWASYLSQQPDDQLLEVIQPWFAWRALVVASPVWYPTISTDIRRKLLNFARQVMLVERYDFRNVNQYLEELE